MLRLVNRAMCPIGGHLALHHSLALVSVHPFCIYTSIKLERTLPLRKSGAGWTFVQRAWLVLTRLWLLMTCGRKVHESVCLSSTAHAGNMQSGHAFCACLQLITQVAVVSNLGGAVFVANNSSCDLVCFAESHASGMALSSPLCEPPHDADKSMHQATHLGVAV